MGLLSREGSRRENSKACCDRHRPDKSNQVRCPTVPFAARVEAARGLWTCIRHLVAKHPLFAGLHVDGMMRDVCENVWATQTLRDLEVEPILASIGFKWFAEDHKLHDSGPGESRWGADLTIVPDGHGRIMVSQLRIVENLDRDPVADHLPSNIIAFTVGPTSRPGRGTSRDPVSAGVDEPANRT